MKKIPKHYCLKLIIFLLLTTVFINPFSVNGRDFSEKIIEDYLDGIAYYERTAVTNPTYGSVGGEWLMMGLARYGAISDSYINIYKKNLKKHLDSCNGVLSQQKYTEYSRVVIGLTAIEENPGDFEGYDMLEPLAHYDKVMRQGLNGAIYCLLAFDSGNYDIPKPNGADAGTKTTRERLIKTILANQKENGGWNFNGKNADADMTSMAIQALAPYYKQDDIKAAIDKGIDVLSSLQQEDGSFCTGGIKNCESTAQVLTAMSAVKISIKDKRFVKNGNSVMEGLLQFYDNGAFVHMQGGIANQMATEQAMYGIAAYYRSIMGMNSLYDMTDGITKRPLKSFEQKEDNSEEKSGKTTHKERKKKQKSRQKKISVKEEDETALDNAPKQKKNNVDVTEKFPQKETKQKVEGTNIEDRTNAIEKEESREASKMQSVKNTKRKPVIVLFLIVAVIVLGMYIYKKRKNYEKKKKE